MTFAERETVEILTKASAGNADALRFLMHFCAYAHAIDDIIDDLWAKKDVPPARILDTFAQANILYSQPFYQANTASLQPVVMLVTNAYADSVEWEQRGTGEGEKRMADVRRFAGNEMLLAVALVCGGYKAMRELSPIIYNRSWREHHDAAGQPV